MDILKNFLAEAGIKSINIETNYKPVSLLPAPFDVQYIGSEFLTKNTNSALNSAQLTLSHGDGAISNVDIDKSVDLAQLDTLTVTERKVALVLEKATRDQDIFAYKGRLYSSKEQLSEKEFGHLPTPDWANVKEQHVKAGTPKLKAYSLTSSTYAELSAKATV